MTDCGIYCDEFRLVANSFTFVVDLYQSAFTIFSCVYSSSLLTESIYIKVNSKYTSSTEKYISVNKGLELTAMQLSKNQRRK